MAYDDSQLGLSDPLLGETLSTVYLYLIRHGEAAHNIKEKAAKAAALQECLAEGLSEKDPETLQRMEKARKAVLEDENLRDAHLSPHGREQAEAARGELDRILTENPNLPEPAYVMVSPLTRTLETCDLIFPEADSIHVRDELVERHTGKPPDTRKSRASLVQKKEFRRYSMTHLQDVDAYLKDLAQQVEQVEKVREQQENHVPEKKVYRHSSDTDNTPPAFQYFHMLPCYHQIGYYIHEAAERAKQRTQEHIKRRKKVGVVTQDTGLEEKYEHQHYEFFEEDKIALRKRAHKCVSLLAESGQEAVAAVTHKGYLRELERGLFGMEDATEFDNCEIRIYKLLVSTIQQKLVEADRIIV